MRLQRGSKTHKLNSVGDVDITPMLDVVFILLIFFIVTASYVQEQGLSLHKPSATKSSSAPATMSELVITAHNELVLDGVPILLTAVRASALRLRAENYEHRLVVKVHPQAKTRTVVSTLDQLHGVNMGASPITLM